MVDLPIIEWAFPALRKLEISQNVMADNEFLEAVSMHCRNLEEVVLYGCQKIYDGIFVDLHLSVINRAFQLLGGQRDLKHWYVTAQS